MVKSIALLQHQRETKNYLAILAIGTLSLHVLICLFMLLLYGAYSRLSRKPVPTLVQLADGRAIKTAPLDAQERTPDTVRNFVATTLTLMLNWSGKLPPQTGEEARTPKLDPGIPIHTLQAGERRVATATWQATFALSERFRPEFLQKLAELTPPGVFTGSTQVALVPLEISYPKKVAVGKWKIKLVANLLVFNARDNVGKAIPFNKEIFVQAIDTPNPPPETTTLAQAIYTVRQAGLEIYAIRDLTRENL
ncbi:hypothetical protein [Leptolyngbya sp. 'hensonii']|uniref:hypothetical protein n=1 Tax=Leptolyngbya sp. 'hensonii' TaxID=1922337 RepID=UPI0009F85A6B|nr:hypothetical protein [Leptolyngbya sp. 'hensonii']